MSRAKKGEDAATFIYVTKRFVEAFRTHKITNIEFINFNEFEMDCDVVTIGSPDEKYVKQLEAKIAKASTHL